MAFNGRFVLNLVAFAAEQGLDFDELIGITGKSTAELSAEDCKLENGVYDKLLAHITAKSGNAHIGLQSASAMGLEASGIVGQISQNAQTVKQALEYCCQFANLGCSSLPMALHSAAQGYKLEIVPNALWQQTAPESVRQTTEGMMAFTIKQFNLLTLQENHPEKIAFIWAQPTDTSAYDRWFKCPIEYGADALAIYLSKASVERKITTSNYQLLQLLVQHAHERMAAFPSENEVDMIKRVVVKMANPQFPDIGETAAYFNWSQRTFQRRLHALGYTYRKLVEDTKKELAQVHLRNDQLSFKELAYLLGYAEVSAFNRSFKKWFGQTPKQYKQI